MRPWHYFYAGLRVQSDLAIPEWEIFADPDAADPPDVCIQLNEAAPLPTEEMSQVSPQDYRFVIPETGMYQVTAGQSIHITPLPGAREAEIRLFLLGSGWGALCYQRGLLALHASVVQVQGQAVAFCGASGAGKSSLAAGLVARGYELVSDDLCCLDLTGRQPQVFPATPRLKLWQEALQALDWGTDGLVRDHFRMEKFHVTHPPGARPNLPRAALPLRGIFLLEWGDLHIHRLTGLKALRSLIRAATYRPELIEAMGRTAAYWEQCTQLVQTTPTWALSRPRDWSALPAVLDCIAATW